MRINLKSAQEKGEGQEGEANKQRRKKREAKEGKLEFISIKCKDEMETDSEADSESDDEGRQQTVEEHIRERTKSFNIQLRTNPHDIGLWFKFLDFQEEGMQLNQATLLEKQIR